MHDLHNHIPSWMFRIIENTNCDKCQTVIKKSDIVAIGIREITKKVTTPFVEFECSKCKKRSIKTMGRIAQGTVNSMCLVLLEGLQNKHKAKTAIDNEQKKKYNTKISDKEVKSFCKAMDKCDNFEDVMKLVGAYNFYISLPNKKEDDAG